MIMTKRRIASVVASTAAALVAVGPAPAQAATTWYVKAGATTTAGTRTAPFGTLARAESASRAGDTITVLPSMRVLDGGIALKPGQTLVGGGPSVLAASDASALPRVANSTARLDGDAVRLADRTTVSNLRITSARRGAVYGREVTGIRVLGNNVSGHNTDCVKGYLIPQFNAPTNVPGVGIPISGGLQNAWAAIMVDAERRTGLTVEVTKNHVHHAECGDGIDVRLSGMATGTATINRNTIHDLRQGKNMKSLLAIGLQARDSARLVGQIHDNTQALLGNADDPNFLTQGADSEGVFLNAVGPARLDATVTGNRYTNEHGWGGFSANGLEMVSMGKGARMNATIRDSSFSGPPGDVIEHGGLGTDAIMTMTLDHVTAERSVGVGDTRLLPFNNGDCVLAGSLGARNTMRLTVRDSTFRYCKNNGLALGSNVVNGSGPTTEVTAVIDDSSISNNKGGNVGIRNFTKLDKLSVRIQRTDMRHSGSQGTTIADFAAQDLGQTTQHAIDIGGGGLGSVGQNCLVGGVLAAHVTNYRVSARRNWWGRPGGPAPLKVLALPGAIDAGDPLAEAPSHCP
jgi:hypothetical protein